MAGDTPRYPPPPAPDLPRERWAEWLEGYLCIKLSEQPALWGFVLMVERQGCRAGAAEEREACAKLCEAAKPKGSWCCASCEAAALDTVAERIRARGEG